MLSLEIPRITDNTLLTIRDTSDTSVTNGKLLIGIPGFNSGVEILVVNGFSLNLTACNLNLSQTCTTRPAIPDGIYSVRYSGNPDLSVWQYHLKTSTIYKSYYEKLNLLSLETIDSVKKTKIAEFNEIRILIDAAISQVEFSTEPTKGMNIYNIALNKLNLL